jgi:hypothetical protein
VDSKAAAAATAADAPQRATLMHSFPHHLPQTPGGFWFSYNPTMNYLVTRNARSSLVQIWSVQGDKIWELSHDNALVTTQAQRTPFQDGLLTADLTSRVHLWDLRTGRRVFSWGIGDLPSSDDGDDAAAAGGHVRNISDLGMSSDLARGYFVVQNRYYSMDLSQRFLSEPRRVMKEFMRSDVAQYRLSLDLTGRIATFLAEVEVKMTEKAMEEGYCLEAVLRRM